MEERVVSVDMGLVPPEFHKNESVSHMKPIFRQHHCFFECETARSLFKRKKGKPSHFIVACPLPASFPREAILDLEEIKHGDNHP
jgi:hypothetical protein